MATQSIVVPDMQARVLSPLNSVGSVMVPIGLIIAGPVADFAGIQVWFLFGGVACVTMAILGVFIPAVRSIENNSDYETTAIINVGQV